MDIGKVLKRLQTHGEGLRTAARQPPRSGLLLFEIADRIGLDVSKRANREILKDALKAECWTSRLSWQWGVLWSYDPEAYSRGRDEQKAKR